METMKSVGFYKYLPIENEDSLMDLEITKPKPIDKELLVQVKSTSVNPVDYKIRSPKDKIEENPKILGWDAAGIVVETGDNCELFKVGDEVYYAGDITKQGCNSEFHIIDERIVGFKPVSLSYSESAALPLTSITAYEALFEKLSISKEANDNLDKTILIINASGGVGSMAVQLSKSIGLNVVGTASRKESTEWVKQMGADLIVNHHSDIFEQLKQHNVDAVDYILCLHDTDIHWDAIVQSIKPEGKICSIVENNKPLDILKLKNKSATFVWEFMFTKSMYRTESMVSQHYILNEISQLIDSGKIKTSLNTVLSPFNAKTMRQAHQLLETEKTIGKVVVDFDE
ncbi:zinc-binding alcohol dehydrogenase family protein [Staphylococcus pasteuri]|nr:zinc-binding alcohol dehydrogenase family protein [Staphylococcus pasteuri]MEB7434498.1 zinc-binding alcohol dehydrogenase family protein [Staphylococcus pasteuri]